MLDLSLMKVSYFEIKLPNGDVLNLLKCTQGMMASVADIGKKLQGNINDADKLDEFYKFVTRIINRNKEEKVYKQKQIEDMLTIEVAMYLIENYIKWTTEKLNNPN